MYKAQLSNEERRALSDADQLASRERAKKEREQHEADRLAHKAEIAPYRNRAMGGTTKNPENVPQ